MTRNEETAAQFDELGDRLLLEGESWFKVSAYRRAAKTFRELEEDVADTAAHGRLQDLPGIGEAIGSKAEAYLRTGRIPLLDRLRATQPDGLLRLLRETGLTPRRVRALAAEPLAIDSPEKLVHALERGTLEPAAALDAAGLRTVRAWRAQKARNVMTPPAAPGRPRT